MHFMSQPRYNTRTQRDDWYYRIKESFRDLTGRVRGRVMLSVGFIEEPHRPEDIRDIGKCLTYLHEHQGQEDLLGNPLSRYNEFVRRKSQEFWQEMVNNGSIDAVKATMDESREKAERLVDVNTIKHTDARDIGAEWSCSMRKGSSIISQGTTRHSCTRRQAICWSESRNKPTSQNPSWSCAEPREPKASSG